MDAPFQVPEIVQIKARGNFRMYRQQLTLQVGASSAPERETEGSPGRMTTKSAGPTASFIKQKNRYRRSRWNSGTGGRSLRGYVSAAECPQV